MSLKEFIYKKVQEVPYFLRKSGERISTFSKKHHTTLVIIFLPVIALLLARVFLILFLRTSPIQFFWLLLYYTSFLILGYIYLYYKKQVSWVNDHAIFITLLGILIPIVLFWWQQISIESKLFLSYEVALKEENNRNISHLQSIVSDLKSDPETIFWRDFSTDKYKQYWDYLSLNYPQRCKDLYARVTIQLDVLNKINQMRRELIFVPNKLYLVMLDAASVAQPVFDEIVSKCQKI